jgi:hypothetical protein
MVTEVSIFLGYGVMLLGDWCLTFQDSTAVLSLGVKTSFCVESVDPERKDHHAVSKWWAPNGL